MIHFVMTAICVQPTVATQVPAAQIRFNVVKENRVIRRPEVVMILFARPTVIVMMVTHAQWTAAIHLPESASLPSSTHFAMMVNTAPVRTPATYAIQAIRMQNPAVA
jgi:hypothetical protein